MSRLGPLLLPSTPHGDDGVTRAAAPDRFAPGGHLPS